MTGPLNRRHLFALLAGLPFVGAVKARPRRRRWWLRRLAPGDPAYDAVRQRVFADLARSVERLVADIKRDQMPGGYFGGAFLTANEPGAIDDRTMGWEG